MAKPRVTATDRLSNVMDVVELGRRTGMLSVERTVGVMLEEGEVYFVSGSPIYATLGPFRGRDALDALARWSDCRFCFDPHASQPIPNVSGVLPTVDRSSPSGFGYAYSPPSAVPPAEGSGIHPGFSSGPGFGPGAPGFSGANFPTSRPQPGQSGPAFSPTPDSWNSPARGYPSGGLGGNPAGNPAASGVNWGAGSGGFGSTAPSSGGSGAGWGAASEPRASNTSSGFGGSNPPPAPNPGGPARMTDPNAQARLQQRPRRAPDVRDLINVVTTYNLSRAHRTVLLLADGEHSVLDLARLSGKPVEEVATLLHELEGQGLVYYYQ
jgi:hypothetical protein